MNQLPLTTVRWVNRSLFSLQQNRINSVLFERSQQRGLLYLMDTIRSSPLPSAETPMRDSKEFFFASDSLEGADGVITTRRGEMVPPLCDCSTAGIFFFFSV